MQVEQYIKLSTNQEERIRAATNKDLEDVVLDLAADAGFEAGEVQGLVAYDKNGFTEVGFCSADCLRLLLHVNAPLHKDSVATWFDMCQLEEDSGWTVKVLKDCWQFHCNSCSATWTGQASEYCAPMGQYNGRACPSCSDSRARNEFFRGGRWIS